MRLGLNLGYFGAAAPSQTVPLVQHAESLGYHSVWTAEAYGSDAVVPLTWVAAHTEKIALGTAILQMPGRTPANTAMTAATLDLLSGGRMLLGLGLSGPQVVEGWHGQPYGKPLAKTREYVEIVRTILKREQPLEHHGPHYDIPYSGDDVDACRAMVKPALALYIGGMGARGRNFYNDLACRYGYEGAAKTIQDLYLDGNKREATAAVPDELVDEVALCGPKERIAELLESWRRSPVTTLIVGTGQPEALDVMAELVL